MQQPTKNEAITTATAPTDSVSSGGHYLREELDLLVSESSEVFDFLEAGSLDGLWFWDLQNPEHEWMSPKFWRTLGYEPGEKEHLASEWQGLIHPDDLAIARENVARHLEDPGFPYDQVVRYTHRSGKTIWIRCRGLAIRDAAGTPVRMLGAHNDLTSLMEARDALTERFEELHAANREKADLEMFTFSASHDLNEPLRTVSGFVNKLSRRLGDLGIEEDPEVALCVDAIQRAISRQRTLLAGLLEYSRLSRHELSLAQVPLKDLVEEVVESLNAAVQASHAEIEVGPLPTVAGDPVLLQQVFLNLLTNALKFRGESDPQIQIRSERDGLEWRIEVEDNGIGFEQAYAERIFQLFQRLHGVGEYSGSGLGLGICKRIIEAHGGEISAVGAPGVGSTFRIVLPVLTEALLGLDATKDDRSAPRP